MKTKLTFTLIGILIGIVLSLIPNYPYPNAWQRGYWRGFEIGNWWGKTGQDAKQDIQSEYQTMWEIHDGHPVEFRWLLGKKFYRDYDPYYLIIGFRYNRTWSDGYTPYPKDLPKEILEKYLKSDWAEYRAWLSKKDIKE